MADLIPDTVGNEFLYRRMRKPATISRVKGVRNIDAIRSEHKVLSAHYIKRSSINLTRVGTLDIKSTSKNQHRTTINTSSPDNILTAKNRYNAKPVNRNIRPLDNPVHLKPIQSQVLDKKVQNKLSDRVLSSQFNGAAKHIPWRQRYTKLQLIILGMACLVFIFGSLVFLQTLHNNHLVTSQVSALAKKAGTLTTSDGNDDIVPSTTKPSSATVANYVVAPNLPRYLNIPELSVHARVVSLGLLKSGALATPNNIFDVGWYNESSQPGQPGAMLIDGHVSSWTSKGVFYGIKTLKPGDQIQVQRGDGTIFTYQVISSQIFPDGNVNMQSAITPMAPGKPGLNLITCTGQVKPGTSEFNERVIVYTEQV